MVVNPPPLLRFPPPRNFKVLGKITRAEFTRKPHWAKPPTSRGAMGQGRAFEAAVQRDFCRDWRYIPGPWIRYYSGSAELYCQPDGLWVELRMGRLVVVEVKLSHTTDAWWKLEHLYKPLIQYIFRDAAWKVCSLEVVKNLDVSRPFPIAPDFVPSIQRAAFYPYSVLVFRGSTRASDHLGCTDDGVGVNGN